MDDVKTCSMCKESKSYSEFYSDPRTNDGLRSQCKKCHTKTNLNTRNKDNPRIKNAMYMRKKRRK